MPILAGNEGSIMEAVAINPAVLEWLKTNAPTSGFAASLHSWWLRKGALSDKQIAAVENILVRNVQRAEKLANAPTVDIKEIEDRFAYAKAKGVARPILRLSVYKFKPAGAASVNAGAIYVTDAESDGRYLGKIMGGKLFASRDCDAETEADIIKAAADPAAAAKAYGIRTGNCCVCGRLLTAAESIDKNIGPICAERFGF
jgi:Family of unknown function (DUF6011)